MKNCKEKELKVCDKIERTCAIIVCVLTVAFMLPIWIGSVQWTQIFWDEIAWKYTDIFMFRIRDGIKGNLLFCVVVTLMLMSVCAGGKWIKQWQVNILVFLETVGVVVFCWVYTRELRPQQWADFAQIVNIAKQFVDGDFSQFSAGSYLATYPQQLGLICLMEGIIKLVGTANAVPVFQFLNCLCAGGISFFGYRAVHYIWERKGIEVTYLLMQGMCLPVFFYTGIVYGEIISLMLMMIGIGQMTKILRGSITCSGVVVMLISVSLAVVFRKNSLIVLIAMGIVLLVTVLKNKQWRLSLLLFVLIFGALFPFILRNGIYGRYPVEGAMPASMWVYIGMGGGGGFGYGAYDGTSIQTMEEAGYDTERADEMARVLIADRLSYFAENPKQAVEFVREKVLWQWIAPCFMSFTHTRFNEEGYPKGLAYEINYGSLREIVYNFMDSYQSFVYLLAVIGTIGIVGKKEQFVGLVWAVILLGGVLFSVLWEAMARYTYPYFALMIPLCAYGIQTVWNVIAKFYTYVKGFVEKRINQLE